MPGPYNLAKGKKGKHAFALVANTVETVTFADVVQLVSIGTDQSAAVFVTVDGTDPSVNGDNAFQIPTSAPGIDLQPDVNASGAATPVVVKLISTGTPTCFVQRGY